MLQERVRTLDICLDISIKICRNLLLTSLNVSEIYNLLSHRQKIIYFSRLRPLSSPSDIELNAIHVAQGWQVFFSDHYSKIAYQLIGYKAVILQNPLAFI